jgi:hypothetical protein
LHIFLRPLPIFWLAIRKLLSALSTKSWEIEFIFWNFGASGHLQGIAPGRAFGLGFFGLLVYDGFFLLPAGVVYVDLFVVLGVVDVYVDYATFDKEI